MYSLKEQNGGIFVVSLLHSERRDHVIKTFSSINTQFEFIDAVNGKLLNFKSDPQINYEAVSKHPNWLTPGAIGCSLSHINIYKKIIEDNLDFALIFEDDVLFNGPINSLVNKVIEASLPDDVTMFYYQSFEDILIDKNKTVAKIEDYFIIEARPDQNIIGTVGYFVGKGAAIKMLQYLLPVHTGADCWADFRKYGVVRKINLIYPMPCGHATFRSEFAHSGGFKSKVIEKIGWFVNKLDIPFVQNFLIRRRKKFTASMQRFKIVE